MSRDFNIDGCYCSGAALAALTINWREAVSRAAQLSLRKRTVSNPDNLSFFRLTLVQEQVGAELGHTWQSLS